ncbi:MAG: putative signal-transduction protein containing cAMP-binding and domain, partial [Burkholderiaceae bacterium]|nr:putative signal-transduction protein containing cAMP-binding and domain [Burkholderiaceae bacterium]
MNQLKTPPLVFEAVRDFLAKHAPYSQMREDALAFLIPRLKLAYFPKDSVIVDRSAEFPPLHIIQSGNVASVTAGLDTMPDRVLQPGDCFPVGSLTAGGQPT